MATLRYEGCGHFRHRLILTYEADAEGVDADAVVRRVLDTVRIP